MLKTELIAVTVGSSDISDLPNGNLQLFLEALYQRVLELAKEKEEN